MQVINTAVDICSCALDCDQLGVSISDSLSSFCPSIISEGGLHWRATVIEIGMGISAFGSLFALIEGTMMVALTAIASFAVLGFALYYVSRYAELTEMEAQLGHFQQQNGFLATQVHQHKEANLAQNLQVRQLRLSVTEMREINAKTERAFEMHLSHGVLVQDVVERNEKMLQQAALIEQNLSAVSRQLGEKEAAHKVLIAKDGELRGAIKRERMRLAEIAQQFERLKLSFEQSALLLQASATDHGQHNVEQQRVVAALTLLAQQIAQTGFTRSAGQPAWQTSQLHAQKVY